MNKDEATILMTEIDQSINTIGDNLTQLTKYFVPNDHLGLSFHSRWFEHIIFKLIELDSMMKLIKEEI